MKKTCCIDTNVLLSNYNFGDYDKIYCPIKVLEEMDNLKMSDSPIKKFKARKASRNVRDFEEGKFQSIVKFDDESEESKLFCLPDGLDPKKGDNIILLSIMKIQFNIDKDATFISYDINMIEKAIALGIKCELLRYDEKPYVYKGWKEVTMTEDEMAYFYEHLDENTFECLRNEYLLINDLDGDTVDKYKWNGSSFKPIKFKKLKNEWVGDVRPRNKYQELAMDLLQDDSTTIKILSGKWGSGKDYLMASHAIPLIMNSKSAKFDKIIWLRNNIEVKDSKQIGFLPGTLAEKILPYAMPLADHVGGVDGLNLLISQGKIELQHLGFIRGRDLKNAIIICSEAENMTKEHLQLIISRMGENTTLWINGDYRQVDDMIFEQNNGLIKSINLLKGNELFGHVTLEITERSKSAELASLLDEKE